MSGPFDRLGSLPVRIGVLVGLALALLLPAGVWLERVLADRLIESRVADLGRSLAAGMVLVDGKLRLAEARAARLARLLTAAAEAVDAQDAAKFERKTRQAPDGTTRLARLVDPGTDAVLWVPRDHPRDAFWRGFLNRGQEIVSQLGSGTVGETAEDVWFTTPGGAEIMYIPADSSYADRPSPEGYDPSSWIDPVRPENNPSGGPIWLPAQRSPRPPLWFATVVAPVNASRLGAVGLDFTIGALIPSLGPLSAGAGAGYLVIEKGGLITHGEGAGYDRAQIDSMAVADLPSPLRDSLASLGQRAGLAAPGTVVTASAGSVVLLASRIARPAWTVVTVVERAAVIAPLLSPLRLMRVVLVSVLSLLLIGTLIAVAADLRRRRSIDEVKARAGVRFNRFFQMLPVPVALTRVDTGELIEVNDAVCRMVAQPRERLIGATTADLGVWTNPAERDQVRRLIRERGFVTDYASSFTVADGKRIDILMAARVIEVDDEPHMLTVIQDLSVQRQLEAKLLQSQKLEAVGRLAGGVAHDFNNLLTAVIGYGELLAASFDEPDERVDDVREILNAARRGAILTRQLLGFARQQSTAPRVVDVNEVVRNLQRMLVPLIGADVTITTDLDPSVGTVMIDPGQLEQVITNLAVNARDAMPGGGRLTIATRDEGDHVVLAVTDTGVGIPDEIKAHIFEPFFTTKDVGQGTGLGLATCYGIAQQAGGTIQCDSAVGEGTTFRVRLPRHGERTAGPVGEKAEPLPAIERGVRRIMVVEDDEMVRRITAAILEDGGYHVVAREGPSAAFAHLLEAPDPIDLVVSDIVMPRMSGPAFGRVLATTHPGLPMLFISGYTPDEKLRSDLSVLGHPFLAKPFTRDGLLQAVASGLLADRRLTTETRSQIPSLDVLG